MAQRSLQASLKALLAATSDALYLGLQIFMFMNNFILQQPYKHKNSFCTASNITQKYMSFKTSDKFFM